jgi:alkylation response protein AidB-like acyl-CoA dehydrogenase
MEFRFSDREEAFRTEVEDFLKRELPLDWAERSMHWPGGYGTLEMTDKESLKVFQRYKRKLAEKGWLTITWPKAYGGREHSYMEQAIFDERTSYYRAQ